MRKIPIFLSCLAAVPTAAACAWFIFPEATAGVLLDLNNSSAGLTEKSVETKIGEIHYLEGGEGETVVLVHGIYSRKEHWVELARNLTDKYHVIALDLPGFGDNALLPDDQYGLIEQSNNFDTVFDILELDGAHIGANSMGARIVGLWANDAPEKVRSLAFIGSPLGVPSPIKSDMDKALSAGHIPLLVQSAEDFEKRGEWLSPNTLEVPHPIITAWMNAEIKQGAANEKIWHAVHGDRDVPNLLDIAPNLSMQTLIMWCQQDRIFHISGATELAARLPITRLEVLEDCGHVPMIDAPEKVAAIYRDFLNASH
uniref:alpha/beta fold hydrolase n=1 Tax=uncultured Erythrobacter sp. TaxID=263913 RepID=UPI0026309906|nr:alpha/beta hydrolase [uncultured Erythrobacter sp.]